MATVDLTNDIAPTHPYRPVKAKLSELRTAITEADENDVYSADYLNKLNRNDLVAVARSLGVELPFAAPEPAE